MRQEGATMNIVTLEVPRDVFDATRLSKSEMKAELAIHLFAQEKLTLGKASRLAEMDIQRFMHLLASRGIPIHYDVSEYEEDRATLRRLGRL
jgi:predicted HTH domain antitoxin